MNNKTYKVALYIRLSKEDGDNLESESVKNQKKLIYKYLKKHQELMIIGEYIDDGYSGSNFNRPAWQRLLSDLDSKKINTIITKDLSRMGRDYISMGNYIERIFPEKSIRYIAINDDIDSLYETPGLEFLQFKLVFNDYYLKDTSKKIRKIIKAKKEDGQFLGWKAVYGYQKDPNDKHKLIIDANVSNIVQYIFNLALTGQSPRQIANILNKKHIPNPSSYARKIRKQTPTAHLWCPRTIKDMLINETYIGNLTQGKRKKINYKSKKEIRLSPDQWIIIKNTHQPIIDKYTFYTVGNLLKKNNYKKTSNLYLLSGFMFCKECGHAIGINQSHDKKRQYTACTYYTAHSKDKVCTPHSNNYAKLEQLVLDNLRNILVSKINGHNLLKKVWSKLNTQASNKQIEKTITIKKNQINKNLDYIEQIYEDKLTGTITNTTFQRLTHKYQEDNLLQEKEIQRLTKQLAYQQAKSKKEIYAQIKQLLTFQNISRKVLVNLIDKVTIDQYKNIEIYYKFKQ